MFSCAAKPEKSVNVGRGERGKKTEDLYRINEELLRACKSLLGGFMTRQKHRLLIEREYCTLLTHIMERESLPIIGVVASASGQKDDMDLTTEYTTQLSLMYRAACRTVHIDDPSLV